MPESANKTDIFLHYHSVHTTLWIQNNLYLTDAFLVFLSCAQRDASGQPDQIVKNMPEMANLVYNMYMHMIQTSQKYRQVRK